MRDLLVTAEPEGERADLSGPVFAFALYVLCHAWMPFARELPASAWALVSSSLQYAVFFCLYLAVDDRIGRGRRRFAWGALSTLAAALVLLDGLLLRMTSLPLREILPMLFASQHVVEGMREIGLKPLRLLLLVVMLCMAAGAGGVLRLVLGQLLAARARPRTGTWFAGALIALLIAFSAEQSRSRDDDDYLYRGVRMPLYAQLFTTSSKSIEIALPPPLEHSTRARWLARVGAAKRPRHVLYVLLESFRADAVDPKVSPTIWELAQRSVWYTNALAEATYTPLSWSVLLFDESAADNIFGRHSGRPQPLGGWLFSVMHKAGLDTHAYVSTNLTYAKTRERLLGSEAHLDFFQAAADIGEDPADKNQNDRTAVDRAIQFVQKQAWSADDPQFLLLQLDSTHYTYPFPEDQAVFTPYSENLVLPRPIETQAEAELLQNRYRNAAHFVDAQLARLIAALKTAGVYDDMLIVLTADHGEGLVPGLQGHAAVGESTKRVPLIVRVPGEPAARVEHLVSHRDILPSLAKHLAIELPQGMFRGRGLDQGDARGVLTIAPSGRFGQLTTPSYVVNLRMVFTHESVIATPAQIEPTRGITGNAEPSSNEWLPSLTDFMQNTGLAH